MKINVLVKPGSKVEKVVEETPENIVIYTHARAHDGEANEAVVKMLAKYYDVSKCRVAIVSGRKSRKKAVEICEVIPCAG